MTLGTLRPDPFLKMAPNRLKGSSKKSLSIDGMAVQNPIPFSIRHPSKLT
jgi:hypothetical protein